MNKVEVVDALRVLLRGLFMVVRLYGKDLAPEELEALQGAQRRIAAVIAAKKGESA